MKHLFCISSPFQADSARRIIGYYDLPSEEVRILLFDHAFGRDHERVLCSLGELAGQVEIRHITAKTNALSRRLRFVFREAPEGNFKVYSGDWRNKLFKFFALHPGFRGFIAMDDGTASLVIAEQAAKGRQKMFAGLARFRPLFISRYPLKTLCPSLEVISLPTASHQKPLDTDAVLFIGCCVVEKGIMREEDYQQQLACARAAFPHQRIVYYPHRSEQPRALPEGFERVDPAVPIEHWFEMQPSPPAGLVSLFSSALINLASDYPDIRAFYMKPTADRILKRSDDIERVYHWLECLPGFTRLPEIHTP
ncbi:hypothetical protein [Larsenimonas rhizosphaerae]|uniref:Uncharacterized protein n=1 Tax=Larsenimonas rhizosphaerae TaxID=2944682 RepID=A0AA42CUX7_9GAMM|nr:hypothetical protein [Larsenimonas rhizosphaerae]MCX2524854.1 hypothetical protein [Larsenimonas rhizosphaerae]